MELELCRKLVVVITEVWRLDWRNKVSAVASQWGGLGSTPGSDAHLSVWSSCSPCISGSFLWYSSFLPPQKSCNWFTWEIACVEETVSGCQSVHGPETCSGWTLPSAQSRLGLAAADNKLETKTKRWTAGLLCRLILFDLTQRVLNNQLQQK